VVGISGRMSLEAALQEARLLVLILLCWQRGRRGLRLLKSIVGERRCERGLRIVPNGTTLGWRRDG